MYKLINIADLVGKDLTGCQIQVGYFFERDISETKKVPAVISQTGESFVCPYVEWADWMAVPLEALNSDKMRRRTFLFLMNKKEGWALPLLGTRDVAVHCLNSEEITMFMNGQLQVKWAE